MAAQCHYHSVTNHHCCWQHRAGTTWCTVTSRWPQQLCYCVVMPRARQDPTPGKASLCSCIGHMFQHHVCTGTGQVPIKPSVGQLPQLLINHHAWTGEVRRVGLQCATEHDTHPQSRHDTGTSASITTMGSAAIQAAFM